MITMIGIGFILNIIVWRRRPLAKIMLYYELAMIFIMSFIPYNQGNVHSYHAFLLVSFTFILLMCECRVQPIVTALMTFVITFGVHPICYKIERNTVTIFSTLIAVICTYTICLVATMQLTYIAALRGKLCRLMQENF